MHDIIEALRRDGRPLEQLTLEEIARVAGVSRATLLRRIGSRADLEREAAAGGLSVAPVASVQERAVVAAAELIEVGGLNALTFDAVAARAGCSAPAVYRVFEHREGLLLAVFERFTPAHRIVAALNPPPPDLAGTVRALYRAHVESWGRRPGLVRAVLADITANPGGLTRRIWLREPRRLVPLLAGVYARAVAAGESRPYPFPVFMQLLAAPLIAHIVTRDFAAALFPLPDWEATVELLADAACRAVAPAPGTPPAPVPPVDPAVIMARLAGLAGLAGPDDPEAPAAPLTVAAARADD